MPFDVFETWVTLLLRQFVSTQGNKYSVLTTVPIDFLLELLVYATSIVRIKNSHIIVSVQVVLVYLSYGGTASACIYVCNITSCTQSAHVSRGTILMITLNVNSLFLTALPSSIYDDDSHSCPCLRLPSRRFYWRPHRCERVSLV